ncbi:MAG TPA: APC family permease [Devosiaceae bacterium]
MKSTSASQPAGRGDRLSLAEVVAIGVGGMVGGGIFAVLGLAMGLAGHAVWISLGLGGVIALITGLSYAHLGLAYRDDGGSFTYIEHAFPGRAALAGVAGWLLVAGYAGTLALYATAFGAYGSALVSGSDASGLLTHGLAALVIILFLAVNLAGAKLSGSAELAIVALKLAILLVFAGFGLTSVHADHMLPVFDKGVVAPFVATALIFVAYEGFELIPNAIAEMQDPERNLKLAIVIAIVLTTAIYLLVGAVALGNLTAAEVRDAREYVLAVAAEPTLGRIGFTAIAVAALLSTASAINATLFGAARLAMVMASEHALPRLFALRERNRPVPWVALVGLSAVTIVFTLLGNLGVISTFASATFLLIFLAVNLSGFRLASKIGLNPGLPALASLLTGISFMALIWHTWTSDRPSALWIAGFYLAAIGMEAALVFFKGARRG